MSWCGHLAAPVASAPGPPPLATVRLVLCETAAVSILSTAARTSAAIGLGYVFGTMPSADLAAKFASRDDEAIDLRLVGSTNPGAVNAGKSLGSTWGALVFGGDIAKGVAASMVGRRLAGPAGANFASSAAVAGHCYPPGRTGGKGVSTSLGQVVGTFPYYLPLDIAVALATAALPRWTQRTWAATATASVTWILSSAISVRRGWPTGTDQVAPVSLPIAATVSSAIIARRFRDAPLSNGKPVDGADPVDDVHLDDVQTAVAP